MSEAPKPWKLAVMPGGAKWLAQRRHAKARALERFGVVVTDADLDAMAAAIRAGKGIKVERRGARRLTFIVTLPGGRLALAGYDQRTKNITTFLPELRGYSASEWLYMVRQRRQAAG